MTEDFGARSLYLTIVEVCWLLILNILSFAGNSLICISVFSNKRLRTTTNLYIIALAVSDLLSAVFVMPLSAGVLINGKWIYGGAIRQLHAFFSLFVIYVSPVTMGLTAVNRFVRMCKSDLQYNKLFSMHKSLVLVAVVWVFVACYTTVSCLFGLHEYGFVPGYDEDSIVHLSELGKMIHYAIVLSLFFLTPLMATIVSYSKVAKMIRKHNYSASATLERRSNIRAIIERQHSGRRNCLSAHEIKLSKSLFAVVFAFMICWIPFWVIVILRRFDLVAKMPRNVELFGIFLFYLSNTINPFIYAGMNPAFRREFRRILLCKRWRRRVHVSTSAEGRLTKSDDVDANTHNSFSLRVQQGAQGARNFKANSALNHLRTVRRVDFGPSTSETSC